MNCNEIQERLTAGEALDEEASAHLRECAACAAFADVCRLLMQEDKAGSRTPAAALEARVREACHHEVAALPRRRLWRRILRSCYAAAALVALLIGVAVIHTGGSRPVPESLPEVDSGMVVDASLLVANDRLDELGVELTLAVLGDDF